MEKFKIFIKLIENSINFYTLIFKFIGKIKYTKLRFIYSLKC